MSMYNNNQLNFELKKSIKSEKNENMKMNEYTSLSTIDESEEKLDISNEGRKM